MSIQRTSFDIEAYRQQMRQLLGDTPDQEVFWKALDFSTEAHFDQWR